VKHWLPQSLIVALLYLLAGEATLWLTVPEGLQGVDSLAAPFWPAAGIALVATLWRGWAVLPGVFLGQLLISLIVRPEALGPGAFTHVVEAILTAFGPLVMMAVIYVWTRSLMNRSERLNNLRDWLQLYLMAGPAGAVVSATWVTLLLLAFNRAGVDWRFWGAWWYGDMLGMITMLPLAVILKRSKGRDRLGSILSFGSLVAGVVLIVGLVFSIYSRQSIERQERHFQAEMRLITDGLQRDLDNAAQDLEILAHHYDAYRQLPLDLFRNVAAQVRDSIGNLQAVAWMPLVQPKDVQAFETQQSSTWGRDYEIFVRDADRTLYQTAVQEAHTPIAYTFPIDGNLPTLGLDVLHHSVVRHAVADTLLTGEPRMSPPIELVQERNHRRGVVIYLASHRLEHMDELEDWPTESVALFSVVLRADDVLAGMTEARGPYPFELFAYDVTPGFKPQLISALGPNGILPLSDSMKEMGLSGSHFSEWKEINASGRTWRLLLRGKVEPIAWFEQTSPLIILLGSFGFSSLLAFLCLALYQRQTSIEHQVVQRTQQLEDAKERAEELMAAKATFLATMSHEIRTPLNGIIGTSEMLRETELWPQQREFAEIIHHSAQVLVAIINDILDYSKLEAGKLELDQRPFRAGELARNIASIFTVTARSRGVEFNLEIPRSDEDTVLVGDPGRLSQVVINLLGNALKFTSMGHVTLRCLLSLLPEGNMRLSYIVEDTGMGIPEEKQESLFKAFSQAHTAYARQGTGLGLAICKQLADAMQARLWFESEEGKGSIFSLEVELPTGDPESQTSAEGWMESVRSITAARLQPRSNEPIVQTRQDPVLNGDAPPILLVEDNEVNQRVASLMLGKLGYKIDIARTGAEAISLWKEQRHRVMLLDCHLPDIDGFEVARRIREDFDPRHLRPIIAMTAHRLEGDRERCLASGMDDYISKPVQLETLRSLMERWMHQHEKPD